MRSAALSLALLLVCAGAAHAEPQAKIAQRLNAEGEALLRGKKLAEAAAKFQEAAARVPEPLYFTNLCEANAGLGQLAVALTACQASQKATADAGSALAARTAALVAKIRADAKAQGISLHE